MLDSHLKFGLLFLLLSFFVASCGSEDAGTTYYFKPYVPSYLPHVTYQSEIVWFENIGGDDAGSISIYNELTGVTSSVELISQTQCYNVIWLLFIIIPIEETCFTKYSYIATVPLDIGVNYLTFTATDAGGTVTSQNNFSVERVAYAPVSETEPNDSYSLAENVLAPATISANTDFYGDYFLLTAEENREYTIVITSDDSSPSVGVYNLSLIKVAESGEAFFSGHYKNGGYVNLWLNTGEQVYILPYARDNYVLGIY